MPEDIGVDNGRNFDGEARNGGRRRRRGCKIVLLGAVLEPADGGATTVSLVEDPDDIANSEEGDGRCDSVPEEVREVVLPDPA